MKKRIVLVAAPAAVAALALAGCGGTAAHTQAQPVAADAPTCCDPIHVSQVMPKPATHKVVVATPKPLVNHVVKVAPKPAPSP
jgi:hypothetical protein